MRRLRDMSRDARGATAVEYGLICALIVLVMVTGLARLGGTTGRLWGNVSNKAAAVL